MEDPIVSVVIPSYNHEKYISETIESILNQTYQNFEIIITDDGSSDDTVKIIKTFSDPRIKLYEFIKNQGACSALNNCIINSKGKYIAYISSDDVWELDKLEKQVEYLDENSSMAAVFTRAKIIDEKGKKLKGNHLYTDVFDYQNRSRSEWLNHFFYNSNCICHPSIMIKKAVYDDIGLYNERMANLPDYDMWIRLSLKYSFHILDDELVKFRVRDDEKNASASNVNNYTRSRFERLHIITHFLKIDDTEFFLKIFPDAEKYGTLKLDMIPYFLARIAYESNHDWKQMWALNELYELMQSKGYVEKLKNDYNFRFADFIEMSGQSDFFKLRAILEKNEAIHSKNEGIVKRDEAIRSKNEGLARRDKTIRSKDKSIREKNRIISRMKSDNNSLNKEVNGLIKENIDLKSNLYGIHYKNMDRTIIQSLFYKFPTLKILLNKNNTGFKNALINVKGYKAIKKNNLFDIGYYLQNNEDIRKSGKDPILHYIYHGFRENRKPNPEFDAKYYIERHADVKNSNLNPLVHYSLYGLKEDRKINKKQRIYKIAIIIKGNNGEYSPTSYVRLLLPLLHPDFKDKVDLEIITDKKLKETAEKHILNHQYDCCIVQRDVLGDLEFAKEVVTKFKEKNIPLIYEIDDDLLNIEKSHPEYEFYSSRSNSVLYLLENADAITVSTEELKNRYVKHNKNIWVIKNALDEKLWCKKSNKKSGDSIKIGYIGSFTHDNDLLIIKNAIINLKQKYAQKNIQIDFYVIGVMKDSDKEPWINTIKIPNNKKVYPEFVKWLKETVNFDFALAPLADNNINKSKSELKYLEYTALGLPGIYSDNGPFSEAISNEKNGLLVNENSSKAWEDQISKLIDDKALYSKILDNATKDIIDHYLLKNRVKEWDNLLSELIY
mgnify:CR=1 FL=1